MRKIAAQYIVNGKGDLLRHGVITLTPGGVISDLGFLHENETEEASVEFYNGILVPGFVNCHCHLELSHLKGAIKQGTGLAGFIRAINAIRKADEEEIISAALRADREMSDEGIVACGDISNNSVTFNLKAGSKIDYTTFIEVFGAMPERCSKRLDEALSVKADAVSAGLRHYLSPHSVYSVSKALFAALAKEAGESSLTSMHFLESPDERLLASHHQGPMLDSYAALGIAPEKMDTPSNHLDAAIALARRSSHLLLVHNTDITKDEAETLASEGNVFFCLCPASNKYITGSMPPARMIDQAGGTIITGTDSLSSNTRLSILRELYTLQQSDPSLSLEKLIKWATINGARALNIDKEKGSLEPGKKPGILLIEDMDLRNMKLTSRSRVRRLL